MDSVITIDCHYLRDERAAAYLIASDGEAAIIDNNTARAVPHLLQALETANIPPEAVRYLIITHVHLDHCGGTAALLRHCPNATVLAHPRGARHIRRPERLVESSKQVYGEELFNRIYGEIEPVDEKRVESVGDGETRPLGNHSLRFLHTPGHASHHISIYHDASGCVFTGDTFGICYPPLRVGPLPFILFTTAPTDFDPDAARDSIDRICALEPRRICITHYGALEEIAPYRRQLERNLESMAAILDEAIALDAPDDQLETFCEKRVREQFGRQLEESGFRLEGEIADYVVPDIIINARGIAYVARRRRRNRGRE